MRPTTMGRDEVLGAALRELDVPEHAPDFHAILHYRLAEERTARVAAERRRGRIRRGRIRWSLRAGAVAAAAAVLGLAVGLPRTSTGPAPATAAEVKARIVAAFTAASTLRGELVFDGPQRADETRWRFALTAQGDFRVSGLTREEELAFDAAEGVERYLAPNEDGGYLAARATGLAPGPPDQHPSDWILPRELGSVVRALLAAEDPRVEEIEYEGRPAWRLDVAVAPNLIDVAVGATSDRMEITVDRQTGMPVKVTETFEGRFYRELRFLDLEVNTPVGRDEFTLDFPAGVEVVRRDEGFRRVDLIDAADIVGYAPLVPSAVPDGYELSEVAVAKKALQTGVEGGNPESRAVVSLLYRRGLDEVVVTTRLRHVPGWPDSWSDPLGTGEGFRDDPEALTLSGGALDGAPAELLVVPRGVPHVWALSDDLVVTVAGDLSRAELLAAAQSLEEMR